MTAQHLACAMKLTLKKVYWKDKLLDI